MMVVVMTTKMMVMMGHECVWRTVSERSERGGRGKGKDTDG
jgi:hypothetical protein